MKPPIGTLAAWALGALALVASAVTGSRSTRASSRPTRYQPTGSAGPCTAYVFDAWTGELVSPGCGESHADLASQLVRQ
jgi:hypothetical protein